jgi:tetratricopeptide (TPR) repeat protein
MNSKKILLISIILFNLSALQVLSQKKYQMQSAKLETRWAKIVSELNTHQEYPRPNLRRNNWVNLNGLWEYSITEKNEIKPNWEAEKILVPYPIESALSGVKKELLPSQNLWYRKRIQKPILKDGEKVILNFGAVDWQATVFLNGKEIGQHQGGYTAFSFDITNALMSGTNELVVKVFDPTDQGISPHGKQVLNPGNIYYTPSSGIWQTVWLETVPAVHIEELVMTPDIDKGVLNLEIKGATEVKPEIIVYDPVSKQEVSRRFASLEMTSRGYQGTIKIPNAKLWSPDDPFLYDLVVRLKKDGKVLDEVKSYFGMRKVSIAKDSKGVDRIMLNNKYTYNLGTLDQGFWPDGLYTAPTDEALAFDIKAIKAMGFNTIRKHIKVEPARWYYHADKLGVMVWQDMVNPNQGLPEGSKQEFEKESKEILTQLHNYPSITTWVLFNEKWGAYDQERLTKWVKETDPSRIVNGHSGEYLYVNNQLRSPSPNAYVNSDMTDVHAYPNPMMSIKQDGKAQVCGEFGGIGVSVPGHQWDDLKGWGYVQVKSSELENKYVEMINELKKFEAEGLSGSIYTQPFDVEGEENGLMTYDREVIKIPIRQLRKIHSQLISLNDDVDKNFHIGEEIDKNDTDDRYLELLATFKKGNKDSVFLRRLVLMAMRKNDIENFKSTRDVFMSKMQHPKSKENLAFKDVSDNYLSKKIDEEIRPTILNKDIEPDLTKIEQDVIARYGDNGEKSFLTCVALRYYFVKDYNKWFEVKERIYKKYPDMTSVFDMNNDAWLIFENSFDKKELEGALTWSKMAVEKEPTANYYDTYSNLLYKLGRKEEAIRAMEKGISLEPGNGSLDEIKKNLEKMRTGTRTWPLIEPKN